MSRNVSIKNLAEIAAAKAALPAVFKPQKVNGKWRMPKWSRRRIANERKRVLRAGGTWEWDVPKKIVEKRIPFKGHKRDMKKLERQAQIDRAMKKMPALIAEYRANRPKKSKEIGLLALLKQPRTLPGGARTQTTKR